MLKEVHHCVPRAPVREVSSHVYLSAYCLNPQNTIGGQVTRDETSHTGALGTQCTWTVGYLGQ